MAQEILHTSSGLWDRRTACGLDACLGIRWPGRWEKVTCDKCRKLTRAKEREDLNEAMEILMRAIDTEALREKKTPQERALYIANYIQTTEQTARDALRFALPGITLAPTFPRGAQ
jgi:hypothetical protein